MTWFIYEMLKGNRQLDYTLLKQANKNELIEAIIEFITSK